MAIANLKTIAGMIAAILVGYAVLHTVLALFLMDRRHMPLRTAQHYSTLLLFRIPLYLGVLAAVWVLVYQLYR